MQRIPNKEFTMAQINELITIYKLINGGEAIICEGENNNSVYKIFYEHGCISPISDNKEKKISKLYQMNLDFSTKPISTISMDGIIVGYEMSSNPFLESKKLYQIALKKDELLHFLKETRKILDYFASKDIIYGDMEERNILINSNNGDILFCDMDNVQLGEYPIDKYPFTICEYRDTRGIDFGIHPYMHNKMLLRALKTDEYLISNFHRRKYFKFGSKKIIDSMKEPEFFNGKYLIDYTKKLSR